MVNPIVSANSIAATGMPALIGSNTVNTPATNSLQNDFKDFISNLFANSASAENMQLASDVNSNEKIKSALYQAAAMINLTGNAVNISNLDIKAMANDMIVSSIMQDNNLSAAERPVFLKALKATAVEIVINTAANANKPAAAVTFLGAADTNIKSTVISQPVTSLRQTASAAVVSTSAEVKTTNVNTTQTPADFEALNSVVAANNPSVQGTVSAGVSSPSYAGSIVTAGKAVSVVVSDDPAKMAQQLLDLTKELETALMNLIVSKYTTDDDSDKKAVVKAAVKDVQAVQSKLEDIKNIIAAGVQDKVQAASLKESISAIIVSLNNIAAVVSTAAQNVMPQPATAAQDNNTAANALTLDLNTSSGQDNNSSSKFTVSTSNQPQEFKSIVAKIVVLLNQLNGTLSVANKQVYAPRPDIAIEMAVNNPTFKQIIEAQEIAPAGSQMAPVTASNEASIINVNSNIAQSIIAQPQAGELKAQQNSTDVANVLVPVITEGAVKPETVQIATKVVYDKLADTKQDTQTKSLAQDIRWVSDVIIKPAITGNEAAAAISGSKQPLFDRVAEFASTIKEQIVMKQVVSNINDNSNTKVNEIKMVLRPENLGSVFIKLEHTSGEIKGSIMVTNDGVRETLKANLPELRAALNNIGISVNNFDISMANSTTGNDFQGQGRNDFSQWQTAAQNVAAENIENGIDSFVNADGYLNYLA